MAFGINGGFQFPRMSPAMGLLGPAANLGVNQPLAGGTGAGQPGGGASLLSNENLGDAWQGLAQGGGSQNQALQGLQQAFGGAGGASGPGGSDPETQDLLKKRPDLTAKDLQDMKSEITSAFKSPGMQDAAYKKGLQALSDGGSSASPQDIGKLMSKMASAAGKNGGAAALDMFDTGRDLMKSGRTPDDISKLTDSAQNIGGGEGSGPENVAQSFDTAAKAMQGHPDMKASELADMGNAVAQRFPGKDPTDRMQAFENGTQMMGQSPNLTAKGVDNMLARGQQQGLNGGKLLNSFRSQGDALKNGTLGANELQDQNAKNVSFDKNGNLQPQHTSPQAGPNQKQAQHSGTTGGAPGGHEGGSVGAPGAAHAAPAPH